MSTEFIIKSLPRELFSAALDADDPAPLLEGARWLEVDADPGFPCRVSLRDAQIGERVLACNYLHHDVTSPYRASGPIFVREHAEQAKLARNEIPRLFRHRQLSLRGYDSQAMMREALVCDGGELDQSIGRLFEDPGIIYLHLHNAAPGCFNCRIDRPGSLSL